MSQITNDINKVTGTIISLSWKLIFYAAVLLLLYEGISKGYEFGHEIFYQEAMERAPGTERTFDIALGQSKLEIAKGLQKDKLIHNAYATLIQMYFYDYEAVPGTYTLNTSMTSKELLKEMNDEAALAKEEAKEAAREEAQTELIAETAAQTEAQTEVVTETQAVSEPELPADTEAVEVDLVIEPEVVNP